MGVLGRPADPAVLHAIALSLARQPAVVEFTRALVARRPHPHRVARIGTVFTFVARLVDAATPDPGPTQVVAHLLWLVGRNRGPAVILTALLLALGERARLECTREIAFVKVALEERDLALLPPYASLQARGRRLDLPLDPRRGAAPLGFLPRSVREALARRRAPRLLPS